MSHRRPAPAAARSRSIWITGSRRDVLVPTARGGSDERSASAVSAWRGSTFVALRAPSAAPATVRKWLRNAVAVVEYGALRHVWQMEPLAVRGALLGRTGSAAAAESRPLPRRSQTLARSVASATSSLREPAEIAVVSAASRSGPGARNPISARTVTGRRPRSARPVVATAPATGSHLECRSARDADLDSADRAPVVPGHGRCRRNGPWDRSVGHVTKKFVRTQPPAPLAANGAL
jgi:hypothetical protein